MTQIYLYTYILFVDNAKLKELVNLDDSQY